MTPAGDGGTDPLGRAPDNGHRLLGWGCGCLSLHLVGACGASDGEQKIIREEEGRGGGRGGERSTTVAPPETRDLEKLSPSTPLMWRWGPGYIRASRPEAWLPAEREMHMEPWKSPPAFGRRAEASSVTSAPGSLRMRARASGCLGRFTASSRRRSRWARSGPGDRAGQDAVRRWGWKGDRDEGHRAAGDGAPPPRAGRAVGRHFPCPLPASSEKRPGSSEWSPQTPLRPLVQMLLFGTCKTTACAGSGKAGSV
jgi:hypothetical protein